MKNAIALAVSITIVAATALFAVGDERRPFTAAEAAVSGNAFACDLYLELSGTPGNLFFSPSSISTALAMTYAGARGATASEMAATLCLPDRQDTAHEAYAELLTDLAPGTDATHILRVANRLWGQQGFDLLPEFLATVRKHYDGGYAPVDFARAADESREIINTWVAEQTEDKIQDLLQPGTVGAQTRLVLTNAVYFYGLWQHAFELRATADAPFFTTPDRSVDAPFMSQVEHFDLGEADGLRILELPYDGEELSCYILLPDAHDGLAGLERRLDAEILDGWLADLSRQRVRCILPRFKLTSQFELGRTLADMGMPSAFSSMQADFSGITAEEPLYISKVVHKAFVDVFEEGTEAAAATAVVLKRLSIAEEDPPVEFRADHPFLFLIRHEGTGTILFMGRVIDPS